MGNKEEKLVDLELNFTEEEFADLEAWAERVNLTVEELIVQALETVEKHGY